MTDCTLDACRICTGCAHGHHHACRRQLFCPTTGETRACRCCGPTRAAADREVPR